MAEAETIFQNPIFTRFILPFAIIVSIIYAVLEKTKLLGEDKHQLNAIIAFSIGLLFVSFVSPTLIIQNMILFLSIAIIMLFVILLLWGFIFGKKEGFELEKGMKITLGAIVGVAFAFGILWATGMLGKIVDILFKQKWSGTFWTNFLFILIVVVSLVIILSKKKK